MLIHYDCTILCDVISYVVSWDGYLYAIDENTGKELWKFKVGTS